MRLTVLGGSAACPNPGGASTGYLVEQDGFSLVLDTGPGTVPVLRKYVNLRDVGAVVISHLHSDHTIDLVPFRYGLRYIPGGQGPRVPLWMPPRGREFLDGLSGVFAMGAETGQPFFETEFELGEYDPSRSICLGPFTVSFTPTRHFIDCWAMRIEAGGRTLVYLADSSYFPELASFASNADVLICEATMPAQSPGQPKSDGHMTAADAGRLATASSAKHLLLTHMWQEVGLGNEADQARSTFDAAITVAESGVRVQV